MGVIWMTVFLLLANTVFPSVASEVCEIEYDKIGCYNDLPNPRTFPNLLLNARQPKAKNNPGYSIVWDVEKYHEFLPRFICDCAKAVSSTGTKFFGIQYYAECWSGVAGPQDFVEVGLSKSCVNSSFGPCQAQSQHCTGTQFKNFIYYIPPQSKHEATTSKVKAVTTKPPQTTTESLTTTTEPTTKLITTNIRTKPSTTTTEPPTTTTELPTTTTEPQTTTPNSPTTTTKSKKITTELPTSTRNARTTTTKAQPITSEAKTTTTEAPPTEPIADCMKHADILISLDISSSISLAEFEKRKQLLADFVARFPVSENEVHFAVTHYNHFIRRDFTFEDPHFYNVRAVQNAILQVPLLGGATLTQKALDEALQVFSWSQYGARQSSRKVLIIVTDGYTYGGEETLELPSMKLQLSGVNIVPVGFGQRINLAGLTIMSNNVLTLDNILHKTGDELLQFLHKLVHVVCEAPSKRM